MKFRQFLLLNAADAFFITFLSSKSNNGNSRTAFFCCLSDVCCLNCMLCLSVAVDVALVVRHVVRTVCETLGEPYEVSKNSSPQPEYSVYSESLEDDIVEIGPSVAVSFAFYCTRLELPSKRD